MTKDEFMSIIRGPFKRATTEEHIRRKDLKQRRDSEDDEDFKRATNQNTTVHDTKKIVKKDDKKPVTKRKPSDEEDTRAVTKYTDAEIKRCKNKIQDFMVKEGISMPLFYEYIDKDGDKRLDIGEFTTKISNVGIDFTKDECKALFHYIDANDSKEVTYREFSTSMHDVNIAYIIHKIRKIMKDVKLSLEQLFGDYDSKDKGYWNMEDFKEFMDDYCSDLKDFEKKDILEHIDLDGNHKIDKGELSKTFFSSG
jgi:Ca2+-binding EF-hand superfamily protein